MTNPLLANVYVWQNGMVMAFDQHGQQMPNYQGRKEDVWEKIQRDKTPLTKIEESCVWPASMVNDASDNAGGVYVHDN